MLRWAEVHLSRLLSNYREIQKFAGGKRVFAVVKANAYGHGSVPVATFLEKNTDVCGFAVATYEEGAELREGGVKREIIVMASPVAEGIKLAKDYNLTPVIYDFEDLKYVKKLSIPFHVKVDTGMGRLGFLEQDWAKLLSELENTPVLGIMSHFSCAGEDENFTVRQFKKFSELAGKFKKLNPKLAVHIDSSASLPKGFNALATHCRVGIALYGSKPYPGYPLNLMQVMEVKAKLIHVKELPPGSPVSYSKTYKTPARERVGVTAFGYADGLPRNLSNRGYMLVEGKRCPIRGVVCMDMTVISVERTTAVKGSTVTVSGARLTFDELAKTAGTISYDIMCAVGSRVKRVYVE